MRPRIWIHRAVVVLLFLLCANTAYAADSTQTGPGLPSAIGVSLAAPPRLVSLPLSAQDRASLDHLWVWSPACPLRRVGLVPEATSCKAPSSKLLVSVVLPKGTRMTDALPMRVVAAPEAAWQEITESLLPAYAVSGDLSSAIPIDPATAVRLRVIGRGLGSAWIDVTPGARTWNAITSVSAELQTAVTDDKGRSVRLPTVAISVINGRSRAPGALEVGSDMGVVSVPALPPGLRLAATFKSSGLIPRTIESPAGQFPSRIALESGCRVKGRVIDEKRTPVSGSEVRAEGLTRDGIIISDDAISDPRGEFGLLLPKGKAVLQISAASREQVRESVDVSECEESQDVGAISLEQAGRTEIAVSTPEAEPIAGAEIRTQSARLETDKRGRAILEHVVRSRSLSVDVDAKGFLRTETTVPGPVPSTVRIVLRPAALVRGTLVAEDRAPVPDAVVEVHSGASFTDEVVDASGFFEAEVMPDAQTVLRCRSAQAGEREVTVTALAAGEMRDLGEIVLPRGLSVEGRVVSAETGEALAGVHVWATRGSAAASLVDWARGAVSSSTSGSDGRFQLAGLQSAASTLRFEAAGYAPRDLVVSMKEGERSIDAGDVALAAGGTVVVHAQQDVQGIARADWRGDWRESDMVAATLVDGFASLANVPAGVSHVSVVADQKVICDGEVTVIAQDSVTFGCEEDRVRVAGVVRIAGHPVGGGILIWLSPSTTDSLILTHQSDLGLSRQEVFGAGRPQVGVAVEADGSFTTDDLTPGTWRVLWRSEGQPQSKQKDVVVPRADEVRLNVEFEGASLRGQVRDESGRAVSSARVVDMVTGSAAKTAEDGSFELVGLDAPRLSLRAFDDEGGRSSKAVEVRMDPGLADQVIELVLTSSGRFKIRLTSAGVPVPQGIVFVEAATLGMRLLTTDEQGEVEGDSRSAVAFRAAGFAEGRWVFGSWVPSKQLAEDGYPLDVPPASEVGGVRVQSATARGVLNIEGPAGWHLTPLLSQMGQRFVLSPQGGVVVSGLPAGSYVLSLGQDARSVRVSAGEETPATFP